MRTFLRCGSGAVFVYLATQLQQLGASAMFLATDINPLAAGVAQQTARNNGAQAFDLVRTDLLQCFEPRIHVRAAVERGGAVVCADGALVNV
jgi:methylase of polypeptide subunit release factors